ncbi:BlaI/MecI/CopY family transcriptional regulator [Zhongshania aquimaris]|uniref:BlaI/MecI/CopY family transcriptional regulator n=1 Tax=Zhongshania aquimaris TaxID=2857107 RepID=UPI002106B3FC|nr:BlaI/MecI/CopY family transcriptional regulator [Zhongshania aquimaris]
MPSAVTRFVEYAILRHTVKTYMGSVFVKSFTAEMGRLLRHRRDNRQAPTLGARELEVMKILWRGDVLSAQDVLQAISDSSLSLSTMQSTLERLYRKELVSREKTGRYYLYRAAISRNAVITQLLGEIADQVGDGDMAPMISGFMSFIDQETSEPLSSEMRDAIQRLPSERDD